MGDYRQRANGSDASSSTDIRPTLIVSLTLAALRDLADNFPSLSSDAEQCRVRVEHEGVGFCVRALPLLGRYLDMILASGQRPLAPEGFKGHGYRVTAFRSFFNSLAPMELVGLLDNEWASENVLQVRAVRSLLKMFSKLESETELDEHQTAVFTQQWMNRVMFCSPQSGFVDSPICQRAGEVIAELFSDGAEQAVVEAAFNLCRNGPGAVVERLRGLDKWDFIPTQRVCDAGLAPLLRLNERHEDDVPLTPLHGDGCTRMILVPKDFRGPRVISCEPAALQYLQQGLMRSITRYVERRSVGLHFTDQTVNQVLAREGSLAHLQSRSTDRMIYRRFATIDMKDASDLVSYPLVEALFARTPLLWDWMKATRSTLSETPVGIIPLKCFAPMGSALCFPIEAIVFWALAKAAMEFSGLDKRIASHEVHVFGDDIIVHPAYVMDLSKVYDRAGLKVNLAKTCFKTPFRESCGADWFNGADIATPRLRRLSGKPEALAALSAYHNQLDSSWNTQLRHVCRSAAHRLGLPVIEIDGLEDKPFAQCFTVFPGETLCGQPVKRRWNNTLHREEFLVPHLQKRMITSAKEGWGPCMAGVRGLSIDSVPLPEASQLRMRWQSRK